MEREALVRRDRRARRRDGRRRALRDEVRRAAAAGASATARKALGFAELLDGDVEAMKRRTRHYARRQLTWMRKLADTAHVDVTGRDVAEVAAEVVRLADARTRVPAAPPAAT